MPAQDWVQITFEKGLNVFDRASVLEDGESQTLQNYEFLPNGGLTPRPAWKAGGASPTGQPTSMQGRGLYTDYYQSGIRRLVATVFDDTANFVTYRTDISDPTAYTLWTQIDTVAVSSTYRPFPMAYATGNNVLVMSNPGMTSGFMRTWNGTSAAALTDAIAGRTLIYFLNRFWTGGAIADPTFLRFSEIGDQTNWNLSENFIPVAQDDGEPIEDICIWDRGLIVGKAHSLHFLSGYTVDNFALAPINKKIGCAPGRSLIPTEVGVFILGIDGNVYLYDGAEVNPVSTKVSVTRPTSGYMSGAYVAGKLYVTGTVAPTVGYTFDQGRWRKEIYGDAANAPQDLASYDDRYLLCTSNDGTRLLSVREEIGPFAVAGYRAPIPESSGSSFVVTCKEYWPMGPIGKVTLRSVYIRYYQWVAGEAEMVVTPVVDGVEITSQAKSFGGKNAAGGYAERVDFAADQDAAFTGRNWALKFSSDVVSGEPSYSIDEVYALHFTDAGRR